MIEQKTVSKAMNDLSSSFAEFRRVVEVELTPALMKLNAALAPLLREWYLARLRRWLPVWGASLLLAALISWWLT